MKILDHLQPENISNIFLYAVIMLANIDYLSIIDYSLKALIGGIVWFLVKIMQDYYSPRVRKIAKRLLKKEDHQEQKK
jgi:hypothetical protein